MAFGDAMTRLGRDMGRAVAATLFDTPTYRWTLLGSQPRPVSGLPVDPWPGDPIHGGHILSGEFRLAGDRVRTDEAWRTAVLPNATLAALHGFRWLRDLRALGTPVAAQRARSLVDEWLGMPPLWHPVAWRSDVLGERLTAWLCHADWFAGGSDPLFERKLLDGLAIGTRHLARVAAWELDGEGCLAAAKGLIACGTCAGGTERHVRRGLRILERELPVQIAPDGGHISRSPRAQAAVMAHLVEIRGILAGAKRPVPDALTVAIDRAAPILRFFRHGDGGLALFNGAREGDPQWLDAVLSLADAKGRAPNSAPHTGFQRVAAERTLLIVDAGLPPPPGYDRGAHAGLLSFELSVGRERIVVNCGAHPRGDGDWELAQRATAAHSTLAVEDRNSVEVIAGRGIGRRPTEVACERREADGATALEMSHDGYVGAYGVEHRRTLYLSAAGDDLRGEDRLTGQAGRAFAVRFHVHPAVQVSLSQSGETALLRTQSGLGWRLRAVGARVALAESIYLGARGEPRRTQQVVLSGTTGDNGATIKWALQREDRKG
ncbi:MAG: heparinase II/III family protein [Alphaproteobacteria bacterium]